MNRIFSISSFILYSLIGSFRLRKKVKCFGFFKVSNTKNIKVGSGVTINDDVYIQSRFSVVIGNNVTLSRRVSIYDSGLDLPDKTRHFSKEVVIGSDAWIGANTIILPGVTIGDNSIIGAGSVVTKDVQSGCLFAGNPARFIRILN